MKHVHGGCPEHYLKRFGLSQKGIIDFSININPLGPPPLIERLWSRILKKIRLYPSIDGEGIRVFYKKRFHIPDEFILPGNGSTEIIYLLPRSLPIESILIAKPSYFDYERASILAGKEIINIYMDPTGEPDNIKEGIISRLNKADALWIGRPNNPTGHMLPKEMIQEISEDFPEKWIIVDEAFIQFVENWEDETLISPDMPKNILVIHSLTKFYGLPGIRIGALISRPENISLVSDKKEPWTINIIAEEIARNLYPCHEYEKETISTVSKERKRLYSYLSIIDGIRPFASTTNFILCRYEYDLNHLLKHLLRHGIFIRDCRNFDGLTGDFFRIGIRRPKENDLLISHLSSI